MRIDSRHTLFAATLTITSLLSAPAFACWDGLKVSADRVELMLFESNHEEEPDDADALISRFSEEDILRVMYALDQQIPEGVRVTVMENEVSVECSEAASDVCKEFDFTSWDGRTLWGLYAGTLHALGVGRVAPLPTRAPTWTVQVAASVDEDAARATAAKLERVLECESAGVLEVGGFPACNRPSVNVSEITDGAGVRYRLSTGVFFTKDQAEAHSERLRELGLKTWARPT